MISIKKVYEQMKKQKTKRKGIPNLSYIKINREMREFEREYIRKEVLSLKAADNIILNT